MFENESFILLVWVVFFCCSIVIAYLKGKGKPTTSIKDGHYLSFGVSRKFHPRKGHAYFLLVLKNIDDKKGRDPIYLNVKNYKYNQSIFSAGERLVIKNKIIRLATADEIFDRFYGSDFNY